MASPAKITEFLPETLPEDFGEWDDAGSLATKPARIAGAELGPVPVPKPAAQAAASHIIVAGSGNLRQTLSPLLAQRVSALSAADKVLFPAFRVSAAPRLVPKPARKKWPILAGASSALLVILAAVMISVWNERQALPVVAVPDPLPAVSPTEQPQTPDSTQPLSTLPAPAPAQPTAPAQNPQSNAPKLAAPVQQNKNASPTEAQAQMMNNQLSAPARIHPAAALAAQTPPPVSGFAGTGMDGSANNAIGAVFGSAQQPHVQAASPKILNVSSAVAFALLVRKTPPIYPKIAKDSRISGMVVLHAQVSKSGTVEDVRVVSGPEMLRPAAVNAVRSWRFKPYEVDNQPTVFETTINVAFSLTD